MVVRNGHLPERQIQTGLGQVSVKMPRARDKGGSGLRFTSKILPPYLRRTKSIEELLPWLYLKGISTGDFSEALAALVDGWRESEASWTELLLDLRARGLQVGPELAPAERQTT